MGSVNSICGGSDLRFTERHPHLNLSKANSSAMKRTLFLSLTFATLFVGLTSCGKKDSGDRSDTSGTASKGTIGMTCQNLNNPFFQLIAQEMEKAAEAAGYTLNAMDGKGDAALQNTQIDEFITQKCDAIFLNPADSKASGSGVRAAHAAGIPVFTFDIQMEDPEVQRLVTYHVGSDNYQGGRLAGESMMKVTGDTGKVGIITLPEANSCKKRVDGFKDYLMENNSKLEIVIELNGKGDRVKGAEVAADMLTAHGDLVGIFGINDPCALGAWASVKEAGKLEQITIIGFDGSPDGKIGVFEKQLYDTPMQFPRQMATKTVENFLKYVAGESFDALEFMPCEHYYFADAEKDPNRTQF
ncbi:MAG TPA: sugar ABC transporter substrate-binding protein [Verrucomicrobiales bacterium]|nr:sugar ABC transporter substrate-binding protein [Roseibacillus sp.]HCQ33890.1 sugar ABC transporter substrate-binding protein [Verrucomicrobiales bacterium]